ncbi:hypothetical protein SAMN05216338_105133 [Bradyrhizobium sp. Rc2d]|nr:hypothetical protein SAMN05216338_105133 [Bradyrhizobium sp. Rc2d]
MAGLVPAIHDLCLNTKNVDARDKPGHDEIAPQGRHHFSKNATDVAVRRIRHPPAAPPLSIRLRSYFFSANTQMTPPCGTLASIPMLLVASASWMRCASTPHPDWIATYCVPSIS